MDKDKIPEKEELQGEERKSAVAEPLEVDKGKSPEESEVEEVECEEAKSAVVEEVGVEEAKML